MIDDDAEYEQRRQIRAQADADVAEFISSLGQDEGSGVPPPPTIKVSEVSSQPVELDFIGFGDQGSGTAPGAGTTPRPVCPECPADSVTITFSGVNLCSGCIAIPLDGVGVKIVGGSIDGTYVLTGGSLGDLCCYQLTVTDPLFSVEFYGDATDCSGDFDTEDWQLYIKVGRSHPACQWSIYAWLQGPGGAQILAFLGASQASFSDPFSNAAVCDGGDGEFAHPCGTESWEAVGAEDGTATLS